MKHAPSGYICPFCLLVQGIENEHVRSSQTDIVFQNAQVTAFISAGQWPRNPGHVLVVPNLHFENLYDLPDELGAEIFRVSRRVALAMKEAYRCEGTSTRQHNEPAGNQDVWHFHQHVFPRFAGDGLYTASRSWMPPEQRAVAAARLREAWQTLFKADAG